MISNSKFQISNSSAGATLIELIVVLSIIVLLSMILVVNFPEIQRQLALSRATYKLAQDLRRAEDLALSGVKTNDISGQPITTAKGYGIYFDSANASAQYKIYADVDNSQQYNSESSRVIEIINISEDNPSLFISGTSVVSGNTTNKSAGATSINFNPPNPTVTITPPPGLCANCSEVGIVLGLKSGSATRTVLINTSGAISVK